ncbi:DUF1206 domain-containing protein [Paenarthrobacter sp. Z7-10]|uniref:DUF1206 domain-containing protein n=1 Tax=Paenarthrobacter sp. Z7-10 TaxID=2787635 RepID=UPI0022A9F39E|nr:DUF1206 domain-containing protein [Paenarthrobacter sp. Z7-10]MCZ2402146.1 DUF1206 domain-containing protein [Paenarthrobacter sp. Z7-10]
MTDATAGTNESPGESGADAVEDLANTKTLDVLARFGFAVTGLVHILIGVIALGLVFGRRGSADISGAFELLAGATAGPWLLWAACAGCTGLAVWQLSEATVRARHLDHGARAAKGFSSGSLAVGYGSMALTLGKFALGVRPDSGRYSSDVTATILRWPWGVPILVGIGLVVIGIGLYFLLKALTRKFKQELDFQNSKRGKLLIGLGVAGHLAKGLALILVGLLIVVASVTHQPKESTGLDGSLKALTDHPYGVYVLVAIAVGLLCYGVFAIIRAKYGRM